jgi:uncharacterized protein (DUF433 family)
MLNWSSCPAVERDPYRVSGAWVFRGTRIPVKALFENLESGARIDDFVSWLPGVCREMAEAVLEHAQRSLQTEAHWKPSGFSLIKALPCLCGFLNSHTVIQFGRQELYSERSRART